MTTVAIVFGGPSNEHEISILTGLQCERALAGSPLDVVPLYWGSDGSWYRVPAGTEAKDYLTGPPAGAVRLELVLGGENPGWSARGRLRSTPVGVEQILNCVHGGAGESGGLQWIARLLGVACTGASPFGASLGMDKLSFGAVMQAAGIPTLPRVLVTADVEPDFAGPYLLKPRFGGSSVGIQTVTDIASARQLAAIGIHYREGALVEPYRQDLFDLNIAFRTYPTFTVSMIERPIRSGSAEIYDYSAKYLGGSGLESAPRELPAKISPELSERIHDLTHRVCASTGITGLVRVDFLSDLSDGEELFVNEVNTIPGAMALYLWDESISLRELLEDQLAEAAKAADNVVPVSLNGDALRSAGGISAKLSGYRPPRA